MTVDLNDSKIFREMHNTTLLRKLKTAATKIRESKMGESIGFGKGGFVIGLGDVIPQSLHSARAEPLRRSV